MLGPYIPWGGLLNSGLCEIRPTDGGVLSNADTTGPVVPRRFFLLFLAGREITWLYNKPMLIHKYNEKDSIITRSIPYYTHT